MSQSKVRVLLKQKTRHLILLREASADVERLIRRKLASGYVEVPLREGWMTGMVMYFEGSRGPGWILLDDGRNVHFSEEVVSARIKPLKIGLRVEVQASASYVGEDAERLHKGKFEASAVDPLPKLAKPVVRPRRSVRVIVSTRARASKVDEDEEFVEDEHVLRQLDGAKDPGGPALAECFPDHLDDLGLKGGHMRLRFDEALGLRVVSEFKAKTELLEDELLDLREAVMGQWSDGEGENWEPRLPRHLKDLVIHLEEAHAVAQLLDESGNVLRELGPKN